MEQLYELLSKGKSPYQVVKIEKQRLKEAGFLELKSGDIWNLESGKSYYTSPYPTSLFAFHIGTAEQPKLRLAVAHTDYPCLKLKPNPDRLLKQYDRVNVEPYGGMLQSTWFDRPLGLAGKIVLASNEIYEPSTVLYESENPLMVIPSLAPHLNRDANQKTEYNIQQELQPIIGMLQDTIKGKQYLLKFLADEIEVDIEDILDYDLYVCNLEYAETVGMQEEFVSAPRIDNLASVSALVDGIINSHSSEVISIIGLFDNEEIGSRSKQGADSMLLYNILKKLGAALDLNQMQQENMLQKGFLLSVDGAHAFHPNYPDKSDPTNDVLLGQGVVIKCSASQRYITDSEATGSIIQLCRANKVAYQRQVNRSGMPGGQTLGPIVSSYLPIKGADIGIPMLAMHSARELAAREDYQSLQELLLAYLE